MRTAGDIQKQLSLSWEILFRQSKLSEAETAVAKQLFVGFKEKAIADDLGRPFSTVKSQAKRVRDKLGADCNEHLITIVFLDFLKRML